MLLIVSTNLDGLPYRGGKVCQTKCLRFQSHQSFEEILLHCLGQKYSLFKRGAYIH